MAKITCAISGVRFECSHFRNIQISHTAGYFHPIFACNQNILYDLYSDHCKGRLGPADSYLLFLAFLNNSGQVTWKHPATLHPNHFATRQLIENNLSQLITVIEQSNRIVNPRFKQPSFVVTYENCKLTQIPNWVEAWQENIYNFGKRLATEKEQQDLVKIENRFTYLILSGQPPKNYAHVIADWADKAAEFPPNKREEWKRIIRCCFSDNKMFQTPLNELKDLKDYIECNVAVGSIHFHSLMQVIKEGIYRHTNYLGNSSEALGYTMLPTLTTQDVDAFNASQKRVEAELLSMAEKAPDKEPVESEYSSKIEYLKAKFRYRAAQRINDEQN